MELKKEIIDSESFSRIALVGFYLCAFYPPYVGGDWPHIPLIDETVQYVGVVLAMLFIFFNWRQSPLDYAEGLTLAMGLSMVMVTAINNGDVRSALISVGQWVPMLFVTLIGIKRFGYFTVKAAFTSIGAYCAINLLLTIAAVSSHPSGMVIYNGLSTVNDIWYLGHKNALRNYFIPLTACAAVLSAYIGTRNWIFIAIGVICACESNLIMVNSLTAAIVFVVLGLAIIVVYRTNGKMRKMPLIIGIISLILVVAVPIAAKSGLLDRISALLGRGATLSGRTILWDQAVGLIVAHPVLGIGMRPDPDLQLYGQLVSHPHNALMYIQLFYGLITSVFWIMLIALSFIRAYKCIGAAAQYAILCLAAFLLCGIFGELANVGFIFVEALCLGMPNLCLGSGLIDSKTSKDADGDLIPWGDSRAH